MAWLFVLAAVCVAFWLGRRFSRSEDEPETSMRDEAPESRAFHSVRARLQITYQDAKGDRSKRKIRVDSFSDVKELGLLKAYCYLRSANRTFRIDRVSSCVDIETGEVVDDIRHHLRTRAGVFQSKPVTFEFSDFAEDEDDFSYFEPFADEADLSDQCAERLLGEYPALVRVLLFVAVEDGKVTSSKSALMARFLSSVEDGLVITDETVPELLRLQGKPSLMSFKQSVGKIVNSGRINPVLMAGCCRHIAEEDGVITQNEQDALDYLDRRVMALKRKGEPA